MRQVRFLFSFDVLRREMIRCGVTKVFFVVCKARYEIQTCRCVVFIRLTRKAELF